MSSPTVRNVLAKSTLICVCVAAIVALAYTALVPVRASVGPAITFLAIWASSLLYTLYVLAVAWIVIRPQSGLMLSIAVVLIAIYAFLFSGAVHLLLDMSPTPLSSLAAVAISPWILAWICKLAINLSARR